ncbi:MAG TPA: response regulator transcription factor [bacterium]|nr:response regulator transcription factor [Dictyoglomota bacterium]HOK30180.1 response regulator transcription factor [bacterium]HOL55587.1 response regulator transcription factor [bacterium]HOP55888.1 response regulator transcription factor [bacterium]HRR91856.1 response regulator transcription factor [bacterium]
MVAEKILIVDDEKPIVDSIKYTLYKEGYDVVVSYDGEDALEKVRKENPDLIILDIMLPKLSGLEVCRIIRRTSNVPIIMLTARGEDMDRVVGLELGADDYVSKPFSMRELVARIKAVLRRAKMSVSTEAKTKEKLEFDDVLIDVKGRIVLKRGIPVDLSPKEFDLLVTLAENEGRVMSREYLLNHIWGDDFYGDDRTVDVHIRWLREKLEDDPSNPEHIQTVRGIGYILRT